MMVKQCLNRRIATIEEVSRQVAAWQADRDQLEAKIDWQFTTGDIRH